MTERFLTPAQIAERLQVSEKTVTRWLQAGDLKGIKIGRLWRVREEDFEAFLQASSTK
jgi:excisionase family DNA binding protein